MAMPEPPETLHQSATPTKILARLDMIRERYRMGLMDPPSFNEVLKLFQFRDAGGVLWTPGAQSDQWYRWDGRQWMPGDPPERLQLPSLPMEITPDSEAPILAPAPAKTAGPRPVSCPNCGAPSVGKKFCIGCGTKLS